MSARWSEMRNWPWTDRAQLLAGSLLLLLPVIGAAVLEGLFR